MKSHSIVNKICLLALVCAISFCGNADCFALQDANVKVVGYSAALKNPDSEYNAAYANGLQPGTIVHLLIELKGQHITEIRGDSKEFAMVDSTGNKMKMGYSNMSFMSTIADDAESVVCPVNSDQMANEKADSLSVKGTVTCVIGTNETEDDVDVKIAKGAEVKLAGLDFTIKDVGDHYEEGSQSMTFQTNKEMSAIKSIEAIMANGKTVSLKTVGNSSWGSKDNMTVQRELVVKGKAADIKKLKVKYFKDLKDIDVPVDVKVAFGFSK